MRTLCDVAMRSMRVLHITTMSGRRVALLSCQHILGV